MRKALTAITASALLALAVPAFAQDDPAAPAGDQMQAQPSIEIDPADPFGEIDISLAGSTDEEKQTYIAGLDEMQRNELKERCLAIGADTSTTYSEDVTAFCQAVDIYFQEDIQ